MIKHKQKQNEHDHSIPSKTTPLKWEAKNWTQCSEITQFIVFGSLNYLTYWNWMWVSMWFCHLVKKFHRNGINYLYGKKSDVICWTYPPLLPPGTTFLMMPWDGMTFLGLRHFSRRWRSMNRWWNSHSQQSLDENKLGKNDEWRDERCLLLQSLWRIA